MPRPRPSPATPARPRSLHRGDIMTRHTAPTDHARIPSRKRWPVSTAVLRFRPAPTGDATGLPGWGWRAEADPAPGAPAGRRTRVADRRSASCPSPPPAHAGAVRSARPSGERWPEGVRAPAPGGSGPSAARARSARSVGAGRRSGVCPPRDRRDGCGRSAFGEW